MAFSINTNNAALEALASLRQTNASLTTAENEVSTGKKVNTASDDPAIYAISQTINSQISELSGVSSGLQVTAQVIGTAQTQASSSSSLLSTLASTLTEGQTNGLSADTINQTITKTLAQIDANANGATIEGVNLLSGAIGNGVTSTTAQSAQDLNGTLFQQGGFNATSAGLGLDGLNVNQAGLQVSLGGANPTLSGGATPTTLTLQTSTFSNSNGTAQDVANKTVFQLNDGSGANTTLATDVNAALTAAVGSVTLNANGSVNAATAGTGYAATTSANASGDTVYSFSKAGSPTVTLTQSEDANGNFSLQVSNGTDANDNVTSEKTFVSVNVTTSTSGTDAATALENAISNQGFGVSKDSETGDLLVAGANLDASGGTTSALSGATGGSITSESGSQYALAAVNAAITSLTKITSSLGSSADEVTGLQNTVTSLSSALTSGVGALTDADLSAESAQLTSLQTKQQLAIQSLSIANSQSQSLLSLFR